MVWSCISGSGVGDVSKIDGIANRTVPSDFDPPCYTTWKASVWQQLQFSA